MAVKAFQSVRRCELLIGVALASVAGADLQAQVGISSNVTQVALMVRAPSHATLPSVSHRQIGRRADLSEAAVRIHVPASSGYRVLARSKAGPMSRVWIHVADHHYQELTPGTAVTLPGGRRGSSEREVRYLTDMSTSTTEVPVHLDLVIDPVI